MPLVALEPPEEAAAAVAELAVAALAAPPQPRRRLRAGSVEPRTRRPVRRFPLPGAAVVRAAVPAAVRVVEVVVPALAQAQAPAPAEVA